MSDQLSLVGWEDEPFRIEPFDNQLEEEYNPEVSYSLTK
jgi:hypothetical protein